MTLHRKNHPRTRCGGQALTEFLVIAVALVPLFLLLPMIGKYQDLVYATQMASRYIAFDATSFGNTNGFNPWKSPAQLAAEVRRRFYGVADAPIKTGDTAGEFDADRNLSWRDPYSNPLIKNFNDISVSFGTGSAAQAGGFSKAGAGGSVFNQIPFANADTIGLSARGIYSANVAVALANLPSGIKSVAPFDAIDLSIQRQTSLVFDPWNSPTTVKTEERLGKLAPLNNVLTSLTPAIDIAVGALDMHQVKPPAFGDLKQWRDEVPADRLIQLDNQTP
jgi:hypothetical protein